jgi:mRNA-degrading endonuclease RelE of RelBE toxin-antitoxin system
MPRVQLTQSARDGLAVAPWRTAEDIADILLALSAGLTTGVALRGGLEGLHRLRVGTWRVIYEHRSDGTVRVLAIGHRSTVYRRDPR